MIPLFLCIEFSKIVIFKFNFTYYYLSVNKSLFYIKILSTFFLNLLFIPKKLIFKLKW